MRYSIHRPNLAVAGIILASIFATVVITVVLPGHSSSAATFSCSGVHIRPGNDLDAIVNRNPSDRATTFCVHASSSGTTYNINNTVVLKTGDRIIGRPGQVVRRGPATYGRPLVRIRNGGSLGTLIELHGPTALRWLDIAGAVSKRYKNGSVIPGTGAAIRAGQATANSRMEYLAIHYNDAQGIVNMNGKLLHSNLYRNGTNPDFWGFTAAAVKGVREYEAAYNYVHDNPANGLWCDVGCADAGRSMPYGFWVHHNLLVDNGRWGVRYEHSPRVATGVRLARPSALIAANEIHENGWRGKFGGASAHDAQNATFRYNAFGPKTIAGVRYAANADRRALSLSDSGRRDRTDLWNANVVWNSLGGEAISGCEKPDGIVYCAGNR